MSRDRREEILARLPDIGKDIEGIRIAVRNKDEIGERDRPASRVLDGDETERDPQQAATARGGMRTTMMEMMPVVSIELGATPEKVGTELNAFRGKFIKAVLGDAMLAAIVGANGRVRYVGCVTGFLPGRAIEGSIHLQFAIAYPLIPSEL